MDTLLLFARLLLAGVFALSGVTKLADPEGSRRAVVGFGIPERFAPGAGVALPLAELALAILLLPVATGWWGALGALLLLLGFLAGIGYNLRAGRTPDCHCFGKLHSEPIGVPTLVRDGLFAAAAAFVVFGGWGDAGASAIGWYGELSTWERVLTVVAALLVAAAAAQGWLLLQMVGQNGRLLTKLEAIDGRLDGLNAPPAPAQPTPAAPAGLAVGSPAPGFSLDGIHGETQTLDALRARGNPVLLVFSSPTCGPCNALMPDVARWQREHGGRLTIAVIAAGEPAANRAKAAAHGLTNVLLQADQDVAQRYHALGTPTAVLVGADGRIAAAPAAGADAIRELVKQTVAVGAPARAATPVGTGASAPERSKNGLHDMPPAVAPNGAAPTVPTAPARIPAPAIALPDLDGNPVSLADHAGEPTVVLFWRPGCGFCQRMLPDLRAWEARRPSDAPRLLIVSSESAEANRAQGLASPILLDPDGFALGRAYGVGGTPAAVLVDGDGYIAGAPAVGAPRVFALLNGEELVAEEPGAPPVALAVGDAAPEIRLPDLDGVTVSLGDFAGQRTVVLFWSPGCVYCQRMLDDLRSWEAEPPANAPRLLVVSGGDPEANRAAGLRSPLVLDQGFATGRAYGASGTPSAILVDEAGKIASPLEVGAANALALAGYVSAGCKACLEQCRQQGGGAACKTVCEMSGQCP